MATSPSSSPPMRESMFGLVYAPSFQPSHANLWRPLLRSDDSFFLSRIHRLGWVHVNHIDFATAARFGGWYPDILDAVLLSRAVGFVG